MDFILQKEKNEEEDMDIRILREQLDKSRYVHSYKYMPLSEITNDTMQRAVPVGTIEFVKKFLKEVYSINDMPPIEVPPVLRKDIFLGRQYDIVPFSELPDSGMFFVKNASKLKDFANTMRQDISSFKGSLDHNSLYQISDFIEIKAEYRVFVHKDKIMAINFYDGSPEYFPDIAKIRMMVGTYIQDDNRPKAYTLDVAVKENDTVLLEIHPWVSVGLYGYLWGNDLPYAYADGFEWYLKQKL